jgi:hypothetical protein
VHLNKMETYSSAVCNAAIVCSTAKVNMHIPHAHTKHTSAHALGSLVMYFLLVQEPPSAELAPLLFPQLLNSRLHASTTADTRHTAICKHSPSV